ncbi:MAG TPA: hypothetical protein VE569_10235 [Acidimicrobiia bacterium]|jgi:hypothetical protein|nr:hypothetical protein [Acidimicrobiia bacterium]
MQFKGQLLTPQDPGPGLRVNLDLSEDHLEMDSEEGDLGTWSLDVVQVERIEGDVFALTVEGESLHFVADDTIGFAYSAVPTIEKGIAAPKHRPTLRSFIDRMWNSPERTVEPVKVEPVSNEDSEGDPEAAEDHRPRDEDRLPPEESIEDASVPPVGDEADDSAEPGESSEENPLSEESVESPKTAEALIPPVEEENPEEPANTSEPKEVTDEATTREPLESTQNEPVKSGDIVEVVEDVDIPQFVLPTEERKTEPTEEEETPMEDVEGSSPDEELGAELCRAIRSDGRRCESSAQTLSGYCYAHDPSRSAGDRNRTEQDAGAHVTDDGTGRLSGIYNRLDKAMSQVEDGELDPAIATAMAHIANTMCTIITIDDLSIDTP